MARLLKNKIETETADVAAFQAIVSEALESSDVSREEVDDAVSNLERGQRRLESLNREAAQLVGEHRLGGE
tara:strand:- start:1514 stop:1726 length:213 start_codon:yes stop_codon:yes gene_type:complete